MWVSVCAGLGILPLVALLGYLLFRAVTYHRYFADGHFTEVAQGVARIKAAALERVVASKKDEVRSTADPRVLVTSAGLRLVYTGRRMEDRFVHHYSVSMAYCFTAGLVGKRFVLFVAKVLGVPLDSLALGVGRTTVHHVHHADFRFASPDTGHHAEFQFSSPEQAAFAERAVPEVSVAEITAFRKEWFEASERLRWEQEESD
jgi:hypothetical protein